MAARLALMRAQRQLHQDADIHIHLRNFAVINSVGAVSLRATLNCEDFASAHTSTAFYDAKSFVGLAWRPTGEPICCGAPPRAAARWPRRGLTRAFARRRDLLYRACQVSFHAPSPSPRS